MHGCVSLRTTMCCRAFPDDFIAEVLRPENRIQKQLEVVTSSRIAMQVERTSFFQDTAKFNEARRHHGEVREHVAFANENPERLQCLGYGPASAHSFLICPGGSLIPRPSVLEGFDLRGGCRTASLCEQ